MSPRSPWPRSAAWPLVALGRRYEVQLGKMLQPAPNNPDDLLVPYLKARHVQAGGVEQSEQVYMYASVEDIRRFGVHAGDLLVLEGGDAGRATILEEEPEQPTIIQNSLHRVRSTDGRPLAWLQYCLEAMHGSGWFDVICNVATIRHLTSDKLASLPVPDPPPDVQRRIICWLDTECTRLSELANTQLRQKALLHEHLASYTTALLDNQHAVPWRLKHLVREPLAYGANAVGDPNHYEWPRFIRTSDIGADGRLRNDTFKGLDPEVARDYALADGDVLLTRSGATVGKSFLYREEYGPAAWAGYLIRVRPDGRRLLPEYLKIWTESQQFWEQVEQATTQATIQNVNAQRYGEFTLPVPPIDEQHRLIAKYNRVRSHVDALAAEINEQLALLAERRHALITAAVTGQIDVQEVKGVA